jgi:hypothetical protein
MVFNSDDLERDFEVFRQVSLTEVPEKYFDRLIKIPMKNADRREGYSSLFLLVRQPLRSFQIGSGDGQTAKELNLRYLSHHVAENPRALMSITKDQDNRLNAFISTNGSKSSRAGHIGQNALHGPGFYTSTITDPNEFTQMGVVLELAQDAKNGTDFKLVRATDDTYYVRLLNKNAAKIIKINRGVVSCQSIF